MCELIQANDTVYYVKAPVTTGFAVFGKEAWLIDSGSGDDQAKKILRHITDMGLTVAGIISTHSNADHTGGNALIQSRTNCRIFSARDEAFIIESPELEPAFLWGAAPPAALKNKFLMAKPSSVTDIITPPCAIADTPLQSVSLPGHFIGMIGVKAPGDVFFVADSVMSGEVLQKYHIGFLYDVGKQFETLAMLEKTEAALFIPAHAGPTEDIVKLTRANRAKMEEICEAVLALCWEPAAYEAILFGHFTKYNLKMDLNQYVLIGATVKAYIAYLKEKGLIETVIFEHSLAFRAVSGMGV